MNLKEVLSQPPIIIGSRQKPTCGRRDCDPAEQPEHWVDTELAPAAKKALELFPDIVASLEWITRCPTAAGPVGTTMWFIAAEHMETAKTLVASANEIEEASCTIEVVKQQRRRLLRYQVGGKGGRTFDTLQEAVGHEASLRRKDGIFRAVERKSKNNTPARSGLNKKGRK